MKNVFLNWISQKLRSLVSPNLILTLKISYIKDLIRKVLELAFDLVKKPIERLSENNINNKKNLPEHLLTEGAPAKVSSESYSKISYETDKTFKFFGFQSHCHKSKQKYEHIINRDNSYKM